MKRFELEPLSDIIDYLELELAGANTVSFLVPHPDLGQGCYAGARLAGGLIRRPLRVWLDLAESLRCRLYLPKVKDASHVTVRFEKLTETASWHLFEQAKLQEKYGSLSSYQQLNKLEDPSFLRAYVAAIRSVGLAEGARILSLGVNTGDEFEPFQYLGLADCTFIGLDHSETALQAAARRFAADNYIFINMDINQLEDLELDPFDLVISLATLQSPAINDRAVLRLLVAKLLKERASLILSFPNGRYVDGELLFGAKMKNYAQPDLSLLVKDVAFYKKYLQQHGFRVFITGKYEVLLTAVPA